MITITDKITPDNYHLIFSAAEAEQSPHEIIMINQSLFFRNCPIVHLPNYMFISGYLHIEGCSNLKSLSEYITVDGNIYLIDQPTITILPKSLTAHYGIFTDISRANKLRQNNPTFASKIRDYI
jgi:hypothetical protein